MLWIVIFPSVLSESVHEFVVVKKVEADVTAYYKPLRDQKNFLTGSYRKDLRLNGKGETFSGDVARVGFIAADLRVFSLGTLIRIPGYGLAVVKDKGYSIKNNRLDVFMGDGQEGLEKSIEWGRRKVAIEVIERSY